MNPQIFRAYDIRGVADRDLTDDVVSRIARAYGTVVRRAVPERAPRVAVGRDCRLSSERIFAAFSAGLAATGVDVLDVGVGASPELYWSVFHLDADGGVQITGSHNPAEHNGMKMMLGKTTLHGAAIAELRALVEAGSFAEGTGVTSRHDLRAAYVADIVGRVALGPRRPRVVLDGGNGAGGPAGEALVRALGLEATFLHTAMDGTFPNHHPDPTVEENLEEVIAAVRATGADLGIAYDGDADRIGVVDDQGHVLWGDRLLILLARAVLAAHPGAAIVGEVKCSQTLFDDVARHGGRAIMSAVGHSIIKDRMKVEGALLAGEMSGHIFYKDRWYGFDDAIYVTARLLEILSHADRPLSALLADVPTTHVTPEIRLDCPDETKFSVVAQAVDHYRASHPVVDIDGARIDFGDGWGLVRASNTQPVIVLRAEADSAEALARIRSELEGFVAARG
ncbi:MAG: phosphomannomutase/phosphoglucomutase [Deltaproteobacteria bacterium]|nr:phosphomannomutase/phosphoglucomutase [Deltaproteobacteria bacterium]